MQTITRLEESTMQASDLLTLIQTRRSIRRYTQQAVPQAVITQILEGARWSPSAHNRQAGRYVVVQNAAKREALARAMGAKLRADLSTDQVPEDVIAADVGRS